MNFSHRVFFVFISFSVFTFVVFSPALAASDDFSDVSPSVSYYKAVQYLKEKGILIGYGDGTFLPENPVSRAEFLKIALEVSNVPFSQQLNCYKDVHDEWFASYVCTAAELRLVKGYNDGYFRPEQSINFVEASKIIVNVMKMKIISDQNENWYQPYVAALEARKAIPVSIQSFVHPVTRAEMSEMMWRLLMREEKLESANYAFLKIASLSPYGIRPRPRQFLVTDLGTLGGDHTWALDLNEKGQVVGFSEKTQVDHTSSSFLWENGSMSELLMDGDVFRLNNNEQIIGILNDTTGTPAIFDLATRKRVATLRGKMVRVTDMNDHGQVVGSVDKVIGGGLDGVPSQGFLWEDGVLKYLGTLGGVSSSATGINNKGQIVGTSSTADGKPKTFLWENGIMKELSSLEGKNFTAASVNDLGHISGSSTLWKDGRMHDLGKLDPFSINNFDEIVGSIWHEQSGDWWKFRNWNQQPLYEGQHAALWKDGFVFDLNYFIPRDSGVEVFEAVKINDSGQILARGYKKWQKDIHYFLIQLPDNLPPFFKFVGGGSGVGGSGKLTITWEDFDTEDNATISLYGVLGSDISQKPLLIVSGLQEDPDGEQDTYVWDLSDLILGTYYVYAIVYDGHGNSLKIYSPELEKIVRSSNR